MDTPSHKYKQLQDAGFKFLAVIGIIALLAIATWGSVQIASVAPNAFSNLSTFTANVVDITSRFIPAFENPFGGDIKEPTVLVLTMASTNAVSGEPYTFSWQAKDRGDGLFAFTYTCRDGFVFEIPGGAQADKPVACDIPFTFINTTNSLTLIPRVALESAAEIPVTIAFTPTGADREGARAGAILVVANGDSTDDTASDKKDAVQAPPARGGIAVGTPRQETQVIPGSGSVTPTTPAIISDPNGKPDLAVRIIEFGTIETSANRFVATSSVRRDGVAAFRFEVINLGTKSSGPWSFSSTLPTISTFVFRPGEDQQSLNPGDRIEYTLSFDHIHRASTGKVTVDVDATHRLDEVTRNNNHAELDFDIILDN